MYRGIFTIFRNLWGRCEYAANLWGNLLARAGICEGVQLDAGANTITKVGYINATVYIASLSRSCSVSDAVSLSRSVCGHPHASHNSIKHCPEPEPSGEVEEAEAEAEEWSLKQKGQAGQRGKGAKRDRGGEGAKDKRAKLKPSNGSSQRYNRNAVTTCDRRATKRREGKGEREEKRGAKKQQTD